MAGKPGKTQSAALLLYELSRLKGLQQAERGSGLVAELGLLRRWQSARLACTHADLLANPRYRSAVEFFLAELYGDRDFSRRDHDLERAYPLIVRTMPARVLYTVALAVELNALSLELDGELLQRLVSEHRLDERLDEATYASAYRACDNYDRRVRQLELVGVLGRQLERAVHNPFIYGVLVLARTPVHLAGFGELHEFIEWGFQAFREMNGADEFLDTIIHRERRLLDRLYAAHPRPFALDESD